MQSKLFLFYSFIKKLKRPIKVSVPIGVFVDQFLLRQLKLVKLELRELLGLLSIEELVTNKRFTDRYQKLHLVMIKNF